MTADLVRQAEIHRLVNSAVKPPPALQDESAIFKAANVFLRLPLPRYSG
jgi:hypothetical protein